MGGLHPVLAEIPLHGSFGLRPWLFALAAVALLVAELGRRSRSRDLMAIGLAGAGLSFLVAVVRGGDVVELGSWRIYSYGALLSCAVLVGFLVTARLAGRDGLPDGAVTRACLGAIVLGFVGGRALYVLTNVRDFRSAAEALWVQGGGLTLYGALGAGTLGAWTLLRRSRISFLAWADAASPGLALAGAIGRLGCYLAGCDYGRPLSENAPAWLKRLGTFPRWPDELAGAAAGSPAWVEHVQSRGLSLSARASLPVHPTELYEAAFWFLLSGALVARRRSRRARGELFVGLVLAYAAGRFAIEMVRGDPERGIWGPLSAPQWCALSSVALVAASGRRLLVLVRA